MYLTSACIGNVLTTCVLSDCTSEVVADLCYVVLVVLDLVCQHTGHICESVQAA